MKKLLPALFLVLFTSAVRSQGLENVIVETYYISDANDTAVNADGGVLPVGSVTYRIYADMLPSYRFQAVYGIPGHELRIETSTLFFNNEDRGASTPTYTKTHCKGNTVMLDSWFSVGAACANNFGVMKVDDDGVSTVANDDNVLQNNDVNAGIPLTTEDGLLAGTPEAVTTIGLAAELAMLDNQNDGTNGPLISTLNGSWASLNGSLGIDSVDNKVLIAQITTDGVLSFKLNIQVGVPGGGASENFVAENPVGTEVQLASLTYPVPVGIYSVKTNDFLMYPNPASGILKVKMFNNGTNETVTCRIFSVNGATVINKDLGSVGANHVETLDVSSLTPGLYFIEVNIDGVKSVQKLVKQ